MLDLYHYYKNTGRYILYLKYSINFFYYTNILELGKLTLFYDVANINDLNSINILSHLFFFKYYFGIIPFFSNYSYKFKLNIHYYSFFIQYNFYNKSLYYPLYFFFNDIYYMINKLNLSINKGKGSWNFNINDINFFIEKKNSLGFFNLKYKLNFNFFLAKVENLKIDNLFYLFKYKN